MVGRPPCLWTCLSSLVKPVDLGNITTAIYEKTWKTTHKHPATDAIQCHLISQRALLQDEICMELYPSTRGGGEVQMERLHPGTFFFLFPPVKDFYLRVLGVSAGLWQRLKFSLRNGEAKQTEPSAFRSELNRRTTVWPAVHNILFQH